MELISMYSVKVWGSCFDGDYYYYYYFGNVFTALNILGYSNWTVFLSGNLF